MKLNEGPASPEGGVFMLKEVMAAYAESFRESDWLVRLQHIYLLAVPVLLVGFGFYLSSRW